VGGIIIVIPGAVFTGEEMITGSTLTAGISNGHITGTGNMGIGGGTIDGRNIEPGIRNLELAIW